MAVRPRPPADQAFGDDADGKPVAHGEADLRHWADGGMACEPRDMGLHAAMSETGTGPQVTLYWLPLGAGGHLVRRCGRLYEEISARRHHRAPRGLVHAALEVAVDGSRFTVEVGPGWNVHAPDRGVVQTGPVGLRPLGRSVLFRYEVRCWRDGVIPDLGEAVGAERVSTDATRARRVLELTRCVPALTWGRDELRAGDMWNSNSVAAWLLACSGHEARGMQPPNGLRAPGWRAGLELARRQRATARDQHP